MREMTFLSKLEKHTRDSAVNFLDRDSTQSLNEMVVTQLQVCSVR